MQRNKVLKRQNSLWHNIGLAASELQSIIFQIKQKETMKRFLVERTWPDGIHIPLDNKGNGICQSIISNNSEEKVFWVHSYVTADKGKSFCIYDGPNENAIRDAAALNNQPVDRITEVRVFDPYFYK